MRILTIINNLEIGGAQRLVTDLLTVFSNQKKNELGLLTIMDSKDSPLLSHIKSLDIELYELNGRSPYRFSTLREIRKIARNYDIVHAHLFPSGYLSVISLLGLNKPILYTEHSTHNRRREKSWFRPIERIIYSGFSTIASISPQTNDALNKWLKSKKINSRCHVINNGIDSAKFNRVNLQKSRIFNDGKPRILMISRFTPAKDHLTLIRAIPFLESKEAIVVFAGEGETLETSKNFAREMGVEERCMFLGAVEDIPSLIQSSTIGVQSSNWEGFGLTAIEMMSGALPVIASDVPGLRDIVENAGLLFEKGNHIALAQLLNELLSDRTFYERIKQQCEQRAKDYDIHATASNYLKLYESF